MYASLEDEIRDALYIAIRQNEEISRIGRETAIASLRVAPNARGRFEETGFCPRQI